jgi:hypothetical protein
MFEGFDLARAFPLEFEQATAADSIFPEPTLDHVVQRSDRRLKDIEELSETRAALESAGAVPNSPLKDQVSDLIARIRRTGEELDGTRFELQLLQTRYLAAVGAGGHYTSAAPSGLLERLKYRVAWWRQPRLAVGLDPNTLRVEVQPLRWSWTRWRWLRALAGGAR